MEANKAFAEKFSFPYPLLCDTDRTIGLAYGAADDADSKMAKRISYLISPDGTIKGVWGKESKIDTGKHAEEVLALL